MNRHRSAEMAAWSAKSISYQKIDGAKCTVLVPDFPESTVALARLICFTFNVTTAAHNADGYSRAFHPDGREDIDPPEATGVGPDYVIVRGGDLPLLSTRTPLCNSPGAGPRLEGRLVVDAIPAVNLKVGRATIQAYPVPLRVRKVQMICDWNELIQTAHMGVRLPGNSRDTFQFIPMTEGVMRALAALGGIRKMGWTHTPNFNENGYNYCVGGAVAGALAGAQRDPIQFGLFKTWIIPWADEGYPVNFGILQAGTPDGGGAPGPTPASDPPRWIQTRGHAHAGALHRDWSQAVMGISVHAQLDDASCTIDQALIAEPSLFAPTATSDMVAAAMKAYLAPLGGGF